MTTIEALQDAIAHLDARDEHFVSVYLARRIIVNLTNKTPDEPTLPDEYLELFAREVAEALSYLASENFNARPQT
jgi:hypothetical protein